MPIPRRRLIKRKSFLRDDQFTALAVDVAIEEQPLDDLGAGGGSSETALAHRFAKLLVFDEFARALHRGEQCAFREAGRRLGLVFGDFDVTGFGGFALRHAAKRLLALAGGLFAVDGQPAGIDDDLAFALEGFSFDAGDPCGDFELRGRIEDGDEAPRHHVKDLHLDLIEILRRDSCRNDGVVIGHLCIVENALVRSHPSLRKRLSARARPSSGIFKLGERGFDIAEVVFGQISRIGPRIRQDLVPFIERLDNLESAARAQREARVGFALEGREVVEERRNLRGRLLFLLDSALLSGALCSDRLGMLPFPNPFGPRVLAAVLLEVFVEPTASIASRLRTPAMPLPGNNIKVAEDLKIGAGLKVADG